MAKIYKILEKNEKKLNISQYLDDSIKEYDEEGNLKEEDYITIKKIPYDIKTKIKFLSMKSFGGETSKQLLKKYKESGKSLKDLQNIDNQNEDEIMEFLLDVDFKNIETDEMSNNTIMIEKYIIEYGLSSKKHTFKDENNEVIDLNYEVLNSLGNDQLMKYIGDNIKEFSKGFMLGE